MLNFCKIILASLALSSLLCKPVLAEDTPHWTDGFNLGGYSSAGLTLARNNETHARLNEVSLLATWNGDSRLSFFGELEFENPLSWDNENQFNTKKSKVDLERLYVDYNLSEKVSFRAGRFLTPNSRWNLLHAPPLVWTSTRPLVTTRLFPTGTNGAMVFGALPFMQGALEYKIFGELLEDQELDGDERLYQHVRGARFSYKNQSDVGISLLSFSEKGTNYNSYRMLGLDFVTYLNNIEISGEGFQRFNINNTDGGSGAYVQTAVPLTSVGLNDWFWITRLETFQHPEEGSAERWLIGAAWHVSQAKLLKLEFTGGSADKPESPRGFLTSFAFLF